jgi:hypothetical protein
MKAAVLCAMTILLALSLFGCLDVFKKKCSDKDCMEAALRNGCEEVLLETRTSYSTDKGATNKVDANTCRVFATSYSPEGQMKRSVVCDFPLPYPSTPVCTSTEYD